MKQKYFWSLILLTTALWGCENNKCQVSCGGVLYFMAIGFTRHELDSVVYKFYAANGSFNTLYATTNIDSPGWNYPSVNDTTSDTLIAAADELNGGFNEDIELYIPSVNLTYKISDITLGNASITMHCIEGGTPSGTGSCGSGSFLLSYTINGQHVTFPPNSNHGDTTGYICIYK